MDPAGDTVSTLQDAENAVDDLADRLRGSTGRFYRTAALFEPRQRTLVVSGVSPLRDARAMLLRLDFAQRELGWVVVGRPLLAVVVRIDLCLDNIATVRLPPVVRNINNEQAIGRLRRQGRRLLTLSLGFSRMRGHDPDLATFGVDLFRCIQQLTDFHAVIGQSATAILINVIANTIANARATDFIRFVG